MSDTKACPFCCSEVHQSFSTLDDLVCNHCGYSVPYWFFEKRPLEDTLIARVQELESLIRNGKEIVEMQNATIADRNVKIAELERVAAATLKQYHENQDYCGTVFKDLHAVMAEKRELETLVKELETLPRWEISPEDEYRSDDYAYELIHNVLWRIKLPKDAN